jgi:hypothetical protein
MTYMIKKDGALIPVASLALSAREYVAVFLRGMKIFVIYI